MGKRTTATLFDTIEQAKGTPGGIAFDEEGRGLWYVCPCGCNAADLLPFRVAGGKRPSWNWDGDRTHPTLEPSIHHRIGKVSFPKMDPNNPDHWETHWHGYLRRGVFEEC